jgi:hypothetical protein
VNYKKEIEICLTKLRDPGLEQPINKRFWFERLAEIRAMLYEELAGTMVIDFGDDKDVDTNSI